MHKFKLGDKFTAVRMGQDPGEAWYDCADLIEDQLKKDPTYWEQIFEVARVSTAYRLTGRGYNGLNWMFDIKDISPVLPKPKPVSPQLSLF